MEKSNNLLIFKKRHQFRFVLVAVRAKMRLRGGHSGSFSGWIDGGKACRIVTKSGIQRYKTKCRPGRYHCLRSANNSYGEVGTGRVVTRGNCCVFLVLYCWNKVQTVVSVLFSLWKDQWSSRSKIRICGSSTLWPCCP